LRHSGTGDMMSVPECYCNADDQKQSNIHHINYEKATSFVAMLFLRPRGIATM
jgi:hypothetical protein